MSGYTLNVGTGTVTRDMLIALEEERDTAREQLAAAVKALEYIYGRGYTGAAYVAQEALKEIAIRAAASTSAETKTARVGDQPDETETNRPVARESQTSTAASSSAGKEEQDG